MILVVPNSNSPNTYLMLYQTNTAILYNKTIGHSRYIELVHNLVLYCEIRIIIDILVLSMLGRNYVFWKFRGTCS